MAAESPDRPARPDNVWTEELGEIEDGVRGERLLERAPETRLRSAVWELAAHSDSGEYHVHHATEELLLVLRGRPTLRTPAGQRTLEEGDVVHFPIGADGAHKVMNPTDDVVRYLMVASHSGLDVIEYLDESRVIVWTSSESAKGGGPLFFSHTLEDEEKG